MFERLGIRPHLIYQEPRLAVDMLRKGEIDAIVAIEGKPLQWLNQVNDRNLQLVPVDYAKPLHEEYLPSKLSSADYPNLVPEGRAVETIAAEALLASYNWAPNSDRYGRLALLVDTMFDKVAQLQRPPFHPKWKELAPRATVAGWTRFRRRRIGSTAICLRARRCRRHRALRRHPRRRLRLKSRRSSAIPCIANSWSGWPAAPRPRPAGNDAPLNRRAGPIRRATQTRDPERSSRAAYRDRRFWQYSSPFSYSTQILTRRRPRSSSKSSSRSR